MYQKERIKLLNQVTSIDYNVRGAFILQTVTIDYLISDILSAHFSNDPDKHNQLYSFLIMPELQFRTKIQVFKKIMKKYYPNLVKRFGDLFKLLEKIRKFRNRVAHAMLDTSEKFLEKRYTDRIRYYYYQDGQKKTQVIKKNEFHNRLAECSQTIKMLIKIQSTVKK